MKLQDYLHYYIYSGIGVYVFPDDTITNGFLAKYKENYPDGVYNPILTLDNYVKFLNDGYKPILRRLEDMTEEEAIAIARLSFFDRDNGYPDSDFKARKVGIASERPSTYEVRIDNDWYDEVIKIGFITGNIWRCNGSTEHLHNQSQIFHYRIKQGFDLFGLIDAGLAIDIKTM